MTGQSSRDSLLNLSVAARHDALSEASNYHAPHDLGQFSLLTRGSDGSREQRSYPLWAFAPIVELVVADKSVDTFISQGEFWRGRRVVNLRQISVVWVDVDTYRAGLAHLSPEQQAAHVLRYCHGEGIPEPSLIISSGRGLYVKWVLTKPIPRAALPRWNRVQAELVAALSPLGADPAAKDASRVLRLVDTTNSKADKPVRVLHAPSSNGKNLNTYGFDALAAAVLPVAREIIADRKKRSHRQLSLVPNATEAPQQLVHRWSDKQLNWDRLEDLRKLVALRGGRVPEGQRMQMIFLQMNYLALSKPTSDGQLWNEAQSLAAEIAPGFGMRRSDLSTVLRKAKAHANGEKVEYGGKLRSPLYTHKNATLIDLLDVTDTEQRQLRTIISPELALERRHTRDTKRKTAERRAAGALDRATYLQASTNELLRARVSLLASQGLSQRKIAAEVGVSQQRVGKLLKG